MESLPILVALFDRIDIFMLIMVRVTAFFIFVPILSGMSIPVEVRLAVAFFLSMAIFFSGMITVAIHYDTVAGFVMLMLTEFMAGALMGFMLFFIFNVLLFAGHFMDFSMGLAMASVIDPIQQIQVPVIGNVLFMSISALLVVNGGLHYFIYVFATSYNILPIGAANIIGNVPLVHFIVLQFVSFVLLAVQIALPIIGTMLVIDISLGVMVKAVPQMNVFVVGMPFKVLVGYFLMFSVMIPMLGQIYMAIFDHAFDVLIEVIWGMTYG